MPVEERDQRLAASARECYVLLQLRHPSIRSLLVAGVDCRGSGLYAKAVVDVITSKGKPATTLLDWMASRGETCDRGGDSLLDVESTRRMVEAAAGSGYVVAHVEDFLEDAGPLVLAGCVQGVLLMAREGRTSARALMEARERLAEASATLLGSILVQHDLT